MRTSGILMPIFSLPSKYGIGTLGKDFLKKSGQSWWQILPLNPTNFGDSPYQSFSSAAGNPYFIDLDMLSENGLLLPEEYRDVDFGDDPASVDYGKIYINRFPVLKKAYGRFKLNIPQSFRDFCEKERDWLDEYALFMALKDTFSGKTWHEWDEPLRFREPSALMKAREQYSDDIDFYRFIQYEFYRQWRMLKEYANVNGIGIIGDMPIYVADDSADIWSSPEQFDLDDELVPKSVAGCPPDPFAEDGQLWGNPLYDWDAMETDNFSWWKNRLRFELKMYDIVRIDHFRGLASYWAVPFGSKTAKNGKWKDGPGMKLFNAVSDVYKDGEIVAEDLGLFGEDVIKLLEDTGFPGIRVIQFGFDGDSNNEHLPHNYQNNLVACLGTHDNNTLLGWLYELDESTRQSVFDYCGFSGSNWGEGGYHAPACRKVIECVWRSCADTVIIAFQDLCGFGSDARMNIPGVPELNWRVRTTSETINSIDKEYFKKLNRIFGR